jgi:hypothetical protein
MNRSAREREVTIPIQYAKGSLPLRTFLRSVHRKSNEVLIQQGVEGFYEKGPDATRKTIDASPAQILDK